ncbi:MAG TPA: hypothetical protein VMA98_05560 [Candidatus Acidoferrales bacterium]|nr:hypothetical protein [Candidatus Acidoferrales bacterium]
MPIDEAVQFQSMGCVPAPGETAADFQARWATAEAAIRALPPVHDLNAAPQALTPTAQAVANQLSQDDHFKLSFGTVPPTFGSVLLEKIVTAQKYIDAEHIGTLQVPDAADEAEVLRFCMRANPIDPPLLGADGGITFSSHYSQNLIPVQPSFTPVNDNEILITARIISRPNYVTVAIWNQRYIISNGYHRAAALLKAGHTRLPCILRPAPTLEATGLNPPAFFDASRINAARPPMLQDFVAANLATRLKLRARNHVLRVGLQVQQFEAPR